MEEPVRTGSKEVLVTEAVNKSSLRYLKTMKYTIGQAHLAWQDAGFDVMSVHKAGWKVRLMSSTYMLQATRAKFNQHKVDPTLLLCRKKQRIQNISC